MEPGDRIVYFDFQCTNEMGDLVRNTLCAELMGRYSNLVLVQNGKIIDALKRAGKADREAVTKALAETKGLATPVGIMTLNANHDAEIPVGILKYENGKRIYLPAS